MSQDSNVSLSACVLKYAKRKFEEQSKGSTEGSSSFDQFLKTLTSPEYSAALPINVDTTRALSQYFISSSHNTYLTGNQLWSKASTDPYKDVLKRGCRCIEIDVWDGGSASPSSSDSEEGNTKQGTKQEREVRKLTGLVRKGIGRLRSASSASNTKAPEDADIPLSKDDSLMPTPWRTDSLRAEPRVLHGHTATREISFRDVCATIRDFAFLDSNMPLIVSFEVHCNHEQQEIMVEIMTDYWKPYLVQIPPDFSDRTPLPPLESLRGKILIKVKYSPPQKSGSVKRAQPLHKADQEKDSSEDEGQIEAAKKGKIIESLSDLGVYSRAVHFDSLDQPEAQIPTHVFAISEKKLIALQEQQPGALFKHNLSFMMRVYPKGTRVRSSNLDPASFWREGIQVVALNWQQMNAAMMLNAAMFEGTGGWVLKPEGYLKAIGEQPAIKRINFDLSIQILAAQNLDQEARTTPNVYIKCELHVGSQETETITRGGKNKGGEWKRRSAVRHSKDPDFSGENMEFFGVRDVVPELSFVRIKVMDDDAFQKDRMLGWLCFRLDRFPQGLRLFQLKGVDSKFSGAALLVDSRLTKHEQIHDAPVN